MRGGGAADDEQRRRHTDLRAAPAAAEAKPKREGGRFKPPAGQLCLMLEIIIAVLLLVALAKRRGGGRKGRARMGRYLRGNVDELLDLGTLAARTLTVGPFDDTVLERTRISSLVATWSLSSLTGGDSIGPILVGVAHSDYSSAEIEEVIENTGSWNEGNLVEREVAMRKVRIVGQMGRSAVGETSYLNEGQVVKTKLNWILPAGSTLDLWAYNLGTVALATTDPDLHVEGHANLWVL